MKYQNKTPKAGIIALCCPDRIRGRDWVNKYFKTYDVINATGGKVAFKSEPEKIYRLYFITLKHKAWEINYDILISLFGSNQEIEDILHARGDQGSRRLIARRKWDSDKHL